MPEGEHYEPSPEEIANAEEMMTEEERRASAEREGKIKQLFGHCFEISRIEEGDQVPVGGENILSNEVNIKVTCDYEKFNQFFSEIHDLVGKYNLPELRKWLDGLGITIDEKLFATLYAFTKIFERKYPDNPERAEARRKLYFKSEGREIRLSDIFASNSAECAEIAALAQGYLQQEGVPSTYFSGEALFNRDQEFSEAHIFIVIRQGDRVYIYDPANPTDTTEGMLPSLYTVRANFDEEMAKGQKRFVTARNILNKREAFYGVNNQTNVIPEKHIV